MLCPAAAPGPPLSRPTVTSPRLPSSSLPLSSTIPPYATGPALILVGALMIENLLDIDWKDITQAVPAFITIAGIPLTYSIA